MLFKPRHDVLNLPQLPRDKSILQSIIADARQQRRKSRLIRFASCNLAIWAIFILLVWIPMQRPHTSTPPAPIHQQQHQQRPNSPRTSSTPN